jgi:hypothetical protein
MLDYVQDMELRNKYGDLEKKIVMLGEGTICFGFLKDHYYKIQGIREKLKDKTIEMYNDQ